MDDLIEMTRRANNASRWDEHFKTLLLLLLETLGDQQAVIRAQALQALRELIKFEKHRFDHYAELTILKVIEAHKDPDKEVCYNVQVTGLVNDCVISYKCGLSSSAGEQSSRRMR